MECQWLTEQDIINAMHAVKGHVKTTPLVRAEALEALGDGAQIWLKLEGHQHTGSFKVRGVVNKMLNLTAEELKQGVTAASSGNHAQAVAYIARQLNTKAVIVMPENAPATKVAGAKSYGAEVVLCGFTGEERDAKCDELICDHGYCLVHSHIDPYVMAGHATAATEAIAQSEDEFDQIVLPCGAGSLTAGAAFAVKQFYPHVKVTAVEPMQVPRFTESLRADCPMTVHMGQTIADGLRVSKAESINYELIHACVDYLHTVEESDIERAVYELFFKGKVVAEPSASVGIAAALAGKIDLRQGRKICFVITGGNIDASLYARLLRQQPVCHK